MYTVHYDYCIFTFSSEVLLHVTNHHPGLGTYQDGGDLRQCTTTVSYIVHVHVHVYHYGDLSSQFDWLLIGLAG